MLDVQLVARAADHRPVEEPRPHTQVLGETGGHAAVRDAVDIRDRETGIREGGLDHVDLERAPERREHTRR